MKQDWKENTITLNGAAIHYWRTGNGAKPPLVLVHGFSDNGLCWTSVAKQLENDYDIIMPDMRGHGLSQRVELGEYVDMPLDVAALIRELGLQRPILGGHSMGGLVSYQMTVRFPELVSALILEDPAWFLRTPDTPLFAESGADNPMAQWVRSLADISLEDLLSGYTKDHPDWDKDLIKAMAESKKQLDQKVFEVMFPRMSGDQWPWWDTLQDVTIPLLLVTGNPEKGGIVTPKMLETVRSLKSDARVVTIESAGHLIRFDALGDFMAAVKNFLLSL